MQYIFVCLCNLSRHPSFRHEVCGECGLSENSSDASELALAFFYRLSVLLQHSIDSELHSLDETDSYCQLMRAGLRFTCLQLTCLVALAHLGRY